MYRIILQVVSIFVISTYNFTISWLSKLINSSQLTSIANGIL